MEVPYIDEEGGTSGLRVNTAPELPDGSEMAGFDVAFDGLWRGGRN